MKCPTCEYLGFETGDRCRNCGYDFSLSVMAPSEPELLLREPEPVRRDTDRWLNQLEARLDTVRPVDVAGLLRAGARLAGRAQLLLRVRQIGERQLP